MINGCIAMSGVYELTEYTHGYFDDDVYFNSPMHYIPNLTDHAMLEQIAVYGLWFVVCGSFISIP
jgi:esterase/lipase superfamily enzyme